MIGFCKIGKWNRDVERISLGFKSRKDGEARCRDFSLRLKRIDFGMI